MICSSAKQLLVVCFIFIAAIWLMTKHACALEAEGIVERIMIPMCDDSHVDPLERPTHILLNPCDYSSVILRPSVITLLRILENNVGQYIKVEGDPAIVGPCQIIVVQNLMSLPLPDCCEGDFEPNGEVDEYDLSVFSGEFGLTDCSPNDPCEGVFGDDGDIDGSDLANIAADFGRTDCP
jgi:hypothetical protein